MRYTLLSLLLATAGLWGCSDDTTTPHPDTLLIHDASTHDASPKEASTHDASPKEAGAKEAGATDISGGPLQVVVDITYPAGAVQAGQRPTIAVYEKAAYPDISQRPAAMPVAALLGQPKAETLKGTILDLFQVAPFIFTAGKAYVIVLGVSADTGMPSHLPGTAWLPIEVTLGASQSKTLVIGPTASWKS
ncbi:MAG: hypothetical protein KAI47_09325 [Deltaproteobacteria bacterium]|nr:hypothetical protein [Deltaproteobacteria bacterium]